MLLYGRCNIWITDFNSRQVTTFDWKYNPLCLSVTRCRVCRFHIWVGGKQECTQCSAKDANFINWRKLSGRQRRGEGHYEAWRLLCSSKNMWQKQSSNEAWKKMVAAANELRPPSFLLSFVLHHTPKIGCFYQDKVGFRFELHDDDVAIKPNTLSSNFEIWVASYWGWKISFNMVLSCISSQNAQ